MSSAVTLLSSAPLSTSTEGWLPPACAGSGEPSPPCRLTTPASGAPARASSSTVVPPKQTPPAPIRLASSGTLPACALSTFTASNARARSRGRSLRSLVATGPASASVFGRTPLP
ncbi:hypothetical protein G6F54_014258 [Rhizopus delemar]|nr:hypothetical protein G6F54_014258 [Rhizopus delemar]